MLAVPAGPAAATPAPSVTLQLLAGSSFDVAPGANDVVRFATAGVSRPAGWTVSVTTYTRLVDRSHFAETLGGTPVGGVLSYSPAVPLTSLPQAAGGYQLTVSVSAGGTVSTGGQVTARLDCSADCPGVYPLRLQLEPPGGGPGADLLTYLVYVAAAPAPDPLRFAWVVPWALPAAAAGPSGTVPDPSTAQLAGLTAEADALAGATHAGVGVTVVPEPWTVERVAGSSRPGAPAALAALNQALAAPAHETLVQSFVPVDGPALAADGLAGELAAQTTRARQVLTASSLHPADERDDTWVSDAGLDGPTLAALGGRVRQAVVPPSAVTQVTCTQTTCTQPFTLAAGPDGGPETAFADPGLAAEATASDPASAVAAAHQVLADLSLVYYEAPNATWNGSPTPRGLVLAPPATWTPSPAFTAALLDGLAGNPLVSAVTLSQFFAQVPAGVLNQSATRRPAALGGGGVPARALRRQRQRLDAFDRAVAGGSGTRVAAALDDLLLAAESSRLGRPAEAVAGVDAALGAQLHHLSLPAGTPIRLTAASARVPITVSSTAPYPVTGRLTVSSDKLEFAASPSCQPERPTSGGFSAVACQLQLTRSSNTVYVQMRSRVSGDFHVSITLDSEGLTLVSGSLTVRSMSTSVVAVALSAGAVVVLLTWWGRTLWRGRAARRPAHARHRRPAP